MLEVRGVIVAGPRCVCLTEPDVLQTCLEEIEIECLL
jgi:hypothetical protein